MTSRVVDFFALNTQTRDNFKFQQFITFHHFWQRSIFIPHRVLFVIDVFIWILPKTHEQAEV
jgi:hypothetical protein